MKSIFYSILLVGASLLLHGCQSSFHPPKFDEIEMGFKTPPDTIQTSVYWYWISDNISKDGVVKDLQAMKAVGINRAFIGNIGLPPGDTPYGKVKLFSEEWWSIMHLALKTAGELGIEIGIFNSPGWSQSGGPWVKPEEAMRYLASSEIPVEGGKKISLKLEKPIEPFQDERVLAFKVPKSYSAPLRDFSPSLSASPKVKNVDLIIDGQTNQAVAFSDGGKQEILIDFAAEFAAQSLTVHPVHARMSAHVRLQVKQGSDYRTIKEFDLDRSNDALNVGFHPYAPVTISFEQVKGKQFRVVFDQYSPGSGITELEISGAPKVERYIEKTLAKMHPTPLPYWREYQWPQQAEVVDKSYLIDPSDVLDISSFMSTDGTLTWDAPVGNWVIMRTGMTPTLVTNSPASPEGTGLEVDKMSKQHVASHFDSFIGEILKRVPEQDRKTWKVVVEDSYETGGQNWTDGFIDEFKQRYQYDPIPYIPVFNGAVVGSQEQSDRFLWDLRRLIADKVAYDYVGGLREVSHKHGLTTWLENYGHWGFPGEFLQYGGQSDEIAGEFWSEGELGDIENRAASSAAHIYGKTKVSAESSTAAGRDYARYPAEMKQRTDRFFTEGINNTLLHLYIQQPYGDVKPGVNAPFGNEFNRNNTWFYDMDLFIKYLKRCNFMLQQGLYAADVAYFIGEDAPKMTGIQDPELPQGYSFDYINAEVIENRLQVENGRFVLPDGMSYKVLVLPQLETMRPELLEKIQQLVKAGGVVLGPRPIRSPSLQGYPEVDQQVQAVSKELWGKVDGKAVKKQAYGKGFVMDGMNLTEVFNALNMSPDFALPAGQEALYIHRETKDGDVYFISNQKDEKINLNPEFRIQGMVPELWDATTGSIRDLPEFTATDKGIEVPLELDAFESAFVVFRKKGSAQTGKKNYPEARLTAEIAGPWTVTFDTAMRGPEKPVQFDTLTDWSQHSDPSIKYYSGSASYHNTFEVDDLEPTEQVELDLGALVAISKVKVNGKELGGLWTPPYRLNITGAVKKGKNEVEIRVVNTWVNRLIGDSFLPVDQRKTWTSINIYNQESALVPAGLFGPVQIQVKSKD